MVVVVLVPVDDLDRVQAGGCKVDVYHPRLKRMVAVLGSNFNIVGPGHTDVHCAAIIRTEDERAILIGSGNVDEAREVEQGAVDRLLAGWGQRAGIILPERI